MNKMIVSNLAYRPLRSIISIFAVAIEVTLILLIVGLMLGILDDSKERQKALAAASDLVLEMGGEGLAWLAPYAVPGQLLGFFVGMAKGLNPDQPRNLTRVVVLD